MAKKKSIPKYNIENSLVIAEFVNNVVSNQKDYLPASCSKEDVSLDRLLAAHYINQADKDLGNYLTAIAPDSGISISNHDKLKESLILDFKNVSSALDDLKKNGAYPASVNVFRPFKDLTDKLIGELSSSSPSINFLDDLISEKEYLDMASKTYRSFLGEGYEKFSSAINNARDSLSDFNRVYNTPAPEVEVLKTLQNHLVKDLQDIVNSADYMLTLMGWAANINDGAKTNKVLEAVNPVLQDMNTNTFSINFTADLNKLDDALTFGQNFIEARIATLDLTNLIGVCVNDILLQMSADQ